MASPYALHSALTVFSTLNMIAEAGLGPDAATRTLAEVLDHCYPPSTECPEQGDLYIWLGCENGEWRPAVWKRAGGEILPLITASRIAAKEIANKPGSMHRGICYRFKAMEKVAEISK